MTIRLTYDEFEEQFQEADEEELRFDPADKLDITWKFDSRIAQGWQREIELRREVYLEIARFQYTDRMIIIHPKQWEGHHIYCRFQLAGNGQGILASRPDEVSYLHAAGKYALRSSGLHPQLVGEYDVKPWFYVQICIHLSVLRSFAASPEGELPRNLQHLVKPLSKEVGGWSRDITPTMTPILQQILNCPYQGMIKRAFLESKVIELMALVLDHEIAIQQGEVKQGILKPEQLERIHYAKKILLRDLNNPPSLEELARQAGLNEFTLKYGFRQTFGTTVFGELRSHRLDIAKQLLAEQDISVTETAHRVGYACVRSFAKAFKRKFGLGPKAYQKARR